MRKLFLLLVAFFLVALAYDSAEAQINRRNNRRMANFRGFKTKFGGSRRYISLGFNVNALNYFGDIAPASNFASTDISFTRPGIGINASLRLGPQFTIRTDLMYGRISSSDYESADINDATARYRYVRNLSFRNDIKEFAALAVFDFKENSGTFASRAEFTPYVFGGVSVFHHDPKAQVPDFYYPSLTASPQPLANAGDWVSLKDLGTEGQYSDQYAVEPYSNFQLAVPVGLGFRFVANQAIDFSVEFAYRFLFFDYIDDVSGNYVNLNDLDSDLARAMSDRSLEPTDVRSGDSRNLERVQEFIRVDDNGRFAGYGSVPERADLENPRGDADDNDAIFITRIQIQYIIGASFRRAKYR
ncbi:DUF6089 family protein [Roseivirga sp. BDSF3-8]|uniref:DUF6089 family protein n=1 Tax=Roseivirga sp. BDSF3-8 TaxID=3241598 RepID=UPI003531B15B